MLGAVMKLFGDSNERDIKRKLKVVERINELEPSFQQLSDEQLREKTNASRGFCYCA